MVNDLKKALVSFFTVLFLAAFASAVTPADISLDLIADTFFVSPGETFTLNFTLYNPMPAGDDSINRIDVYLLDLKAAGLSVVSVQNNGWKSEYIERYDDEQFWITDATRQNLSITLKAESNAKTAEVSGFYSFNKFSGTPMLKDHAEFKIKLNVVPAGSAKQPPAKSVIPQKEQDLNNLVLVLTAVIVILAVVLVFVLLRLRKHHHAEHHLRRH